MSLGRRPREKQPLKVLLVVLACVTGLTALPAVAAPLSVASTTLSNFRACTLTVRGGSAIEGRDSQVDQASPNTNSTSSITNVRSAALANQRTYVWFDLTKCVPAIPSSATVTSALLRLYPTTIPTACRTHDIFRVGSSWTETGITWNNQPFGTSINNPPTASRTSSIDIGSAPCQNSVVNTYISGWDVTNDIRAFVAGTTNDGWMIRDDAEGSILARTASYRTKNDANSVRSPQLIVNYR